MWQSRLLVAPAVRMEGVTLCLAAAPVKVLGVPLRQCWAEVEVVQEPGQQG